MEHKVLQVSCVYDKPGIILHVSHSHKSHDNTGLSKHSCLPLKHSALSTYVL